MLLDVAFPSPFELFAESSGFTITIVIAIILIIILTIIFIWRNIK